jgi:hypothetical protein
MHFFSKVAPAVLAIFISTATAAPEAIPEAVPEAAPEPQKKPTCIVPLILFNSLPKPFTLSALIPGKSHGPFQNSIPVRVTPFSPSKEEPSIPIISRAKIAPTFFTLKDNKLLVDGFEASRLPTTKPFPLPLQAFDFGGPRDVWGINFTAQYACDNKGKQYLQLDIDDSSLRGFVVRKVEEGQRVLVEPEPSNDKFVRTPLKITGGR